MNRKDWRFCATSLYCDLVKLLTLVINETWVPVVLWKINMCFYLIKNFYIKWINFFELNCTFSIRIHVRWFTQFSNFFSFIFSISSCVLTSTCSTIQRTFHNEIKMIVAGTVKKASVWSSVCLYNWPYMYSLFLRLQSIWDRFRSTIILQGLWIWLEIFISKRYGLGENTVARKHSKSAQPSNSGSFCTWDNTR